MPYVTISYKQSESAKVQLIFSRINQWFTEVSTKKYLWPVQGLISRSFEYPNGITFNQLKQFFNNAPVWIKLGVKSVEEVATQSLILDNNDNLTEISFGYLASNLNYTCYKANRLGGEIKWIADYRNKCLTIHHQRNEFRLNQDCLEKYFISVISQGTPYKIILFLKAPPRCYVAPAYRGQFYQRQLDFGKINQSCLANSSAVCLQFSCVQSINACLQFLVDVMQMDCHYARMAFTLMPVQIGDFNNIILDFWSSYAYQMIISLGHRITVQIKRDAILKIQRLSYESTGQPYSSHPCYLKLTTLYYSARRNYFFDINLAFDQTQPIPSGIILDKWEYVPRIYLTPYGVYPLPIKPMRGNRILRERNLFGPGEHFCRVIIRDIDLGQPQQDFMKTNEQWIRNMFVGNNYIAIGNRAFYFLLCSNSQLRDRSFWFYAPYGGYQAENIREWMGDFSHEKCVGTRIARMALSLTGTTATIKLLPHQMELIEDKLDASGRQFTDGIGKISPEALRQALMVYNPELIEDGYMPPVIQARLNGNKGVFAVDPSLADRGILVQFRDSQHKFETNHNVLEIVKHANSGMAFLNRQVIVLLENMGVEEHIFLKLQNKVRMKISMSLLANSSAQHVLEQQCRSYDWERMRQSGIQLTKEPFARSLLLLLANERLRRLKEKSHVQIPLADGRMLIGVVDETGSLRYGQVFIQLRNLNDERQVLKDREVIVTKNPAHFPGDIRKLRAVDCPALHHLYECVVFPAQGPRPHPNEISGSDLDGDEYWVCWNEDLVTHARHQHDPATFDSAPKTKYPGDITMEVIADFLFKYLSSDSLGALSNRHLACCAANGPTHLHSLTLASIISQAVDFPKTGILPKIPKNIKLQEYPDYMENKFKGTFVSDSSIGSMYRQIKEVWEMHSVYLDQLEDQQVSIDGNLLIGGYQKYLAEAKFDYQYYSDRINAILTIYNLPNEYELITGCHSCAEEEKKNNDSAETASLEFRHLIHEMRGRFSENNLNYTEKLRKASAWYFTAYKAGTILSFGWIMNFLMCDIMKSKQLPQEEHQAWKRIGKAIRDTGFEEAIGSTALLSRLLIEEPANFCDVEKLGWQFLTLIDRFNETPLGQSHANEYLMFLHRVALQIL